MARSDREEIIAEEHQQILNKEVEGSFEANNSNPGLNQYIHKVVVMLRQKKENGKEKFYPYWHVEEQQSLKFQKFQVTTAKVERFSSYVKTTLHITDGTEAVQKVTHINFIAWPDHDVPSDTTEFLQFVLEMRRFQEELYVE
ncbi:unnamed protein product [Diatraea saccharalis]|uniref:Tyrosine-protein phosphatase domain-containing protein n=1 Tax=Diatraea saccharalis TaxID=40085 RepID=A0A9N9RA79_9NEOP|nr:unnamed protein product [Diatraea saccharalis]